MRYLFETKVQIISDCKNGMFVVCPEGRGVTLMDRLGQIYDFEFQKITPRDDGTFLCEFYEFKTLLDKDLNVLASNVKDVSEFTNENIALVTFFDDSKQWIKRDGSIFGEGYQPVTDFAYGYGAVKAEDSDLLELVTFGSSTLPILNIENGKTRSDKIIRTGFFVNNFMPFKNPNFAIIELHKRNYIIDKYLNTVAGGFERAFEVNAYGKVLIYEHNLLTKWPEYNIFDVVKRKRIFEPFSYFTDLDKEIFKIPCKDKLYRYVSFKGIPINDEGYADGSEFEDGISIVTGVNTFFKDKCTYLKKDGERFKNWYDECYPKSEGLLAVNVDEKGMFLNDDEKQVGRTFKKVVSPFKNGHSVVEIKGGQTYINKGFTRFLDTFDEARPFSEYFGVVKSDGVFDAIDENQNYLSEISKFAKAICVNPIEEFINLPECIYSDSRVEKYLFELAQFAISFYEDAIDTDKFISVLTDAHNKFSRYAISKEKEL